MGWLRRPCGLCAKPTRSRAARASGELEKGWHVHVLRDVVNSKSVEQVCDSCWEKHIELEQLPRDESQQRVLDMSTEWLKLAPPAAQEAGKPQELTLPDAARKCAIAAVYMFGAGEGMLSWEPYEERFEFMHMNDAFSPGRYDDVLLRHHDDSPWGMRTRETGSVRQAGGGKILFVWRYLDKLDLGR